MSMDKIYHPRYAHIIRIEDKFKLFRDRVVDVTSKPLNTTAELMAAMSFTQSAKAFAALEASVSLEHLSHPDDMRISEFNPARNVRKRVTPTITVPKMALSLKTVANLVQQTGYLSDSHIKRYLKYSKYRHIQLPVDNSNPDLCIGEETLMVVRVYEPFRYKSNSTVRMKPKLKQRFTMLASQSLAELRDRIFCECKFGPFFDISENPKAPPSAGEAKAFDHGFFFIHDTFYNDTRQPTCDYSKPIRDWAAKNPDVGEFHVDSMESTTFDQLRVRIGSPCLYQHHGNCEHVFTVSDVRLIAASDSLNRKDYPRLDIVSNLHLLTCLSCGLRIATKVVCGSTLHLHDPAFLCDTCFDSFHYVDGQKVGEFSAYPYVGGYDYITDQSMTQAEADDADSSNET